MRLTLKSRSAWMEVRWSENGKRVAEVGENCGYRGFLFAGGTVSMLIRCGVAELLLLFWCGTAGVVEVGFASFSSSGTMLVYWCFNMATAVGGSTRESTEISESDPLRMSGRAGMLEGCH